MNGNLGGKVGSLGSNPTLNPYKNICPLVASNAQQFSTLLQYSLAVRLFQKRTPR